LPRRLSYYSLAYSYFPKRKVAAQRSARRGAATFSLPKGKGPTQGRAARVLGRLRLHSRLDRVLHVLDLVDLDIKKLACDFFYAPDIDRLDDVAGFGVDRNRAPRALPLHALGRGDEGLAVGVAAGLLERLVDQVHAVPAADRVDVGVAAVRRPVRGDELRVRFRLVVVVVVQGGDHSEPGVAHHLERILIGDLALSEDLGLPRVDAQLGQRLAEGAGLCTPGNEDVDRLGVEILGALH